MPPPNIDVRGSKASGVKIAEANMGMEVDIDDAVTMQAVCLSSWVPWVEEKWQNPI